MELPINLWSNDADRELVSQTVELFSDTPLVLTDRLTNSVFVNGPAALLLGDRGEALVNRAAYSLLGFGATDKLPEPIEKALLGDGPAWRGIVRPAVQGTPEESVKPLFCEASAINRHGVHVCGILRLTPSVGEVAS